MNTCASAISVEKLRPLFYFSPIIFEVMFDFFLTFDSQAGQRRGLKKEGIDAKAKRTLALQLDRCEGLCSADYC